MWRQGSMGSGDRHGGARRDARRFVLDGGGRTGAHGERARCLGANRRRADARLGRLSGPCRARGPSNLAGTSPTTSTRRSGSRSLRPAGIGATAAAPCRSSPTTSITVSCTARTEDYFLRDPAIASQECEEAPEPAVGRSAHELATWLEDAPGLAASGSTPVSIGGLDGVRIDLRLDPGWEQTCPFSEPLPAVPLVYRSAEVGGYHWVMVPDQTMRWYILDTEEGVIIVDIEDSPAGAPRDELLQTGDEIVQTLAFSQP